MPRPDLPAASALGSLSVNLARAVGPAIAGLLVARIAPVATFALNAASFAAFAVVLSGLRRPAPAAETRPEPFLAAVRAGERYVRFSPEMRRILVRIALFITPAVALWALLPVLAAHRIGLGPTGYGLLRYRVREDRRRAFVAAMHRVREARLRTGALQWGVFRAGEDPGAMVEIYTVSSWEEHRRQHDERLTAADHDDELEARSYADGEPEVTHLFSGSP
ncbi:MFS transporter [Dactylosporangium sp. McL0621]|uniref:MFS transporter n=1 Tax=Dactylosporangium sp. McL0621 TaxID=3415678 RepID=UPI003CF16ABA